MLNSINESAFIQPTTSPLDSLMDKMENELYKQKEKILQTSELLIDIDKEINILIKKNFANIIRLNIGGKIFIIQLAELLSIKDTLFYKIYYFNKNDFDKEIFFDRSPQLFPFLLNYLKYKTIDYDLLSLQELKELKIEAEYYEINNIITYIDSRPLELKIIQANWRESYSPSDRLGKNILQDLIDKNRSKGYQLFRKCSIIFELNYEWRIDKIYYASLNTGNYYNPDNFKVRIKISSNNLTWETLSYLPTSIKDNTIMIKCNGEKGKYIKFTSKYDLGLGYLEIKPV